MPGAVSMRRRASLHPDTGRRGRRDQPLPCGDGARRAELASHRMEFRCATWRLDDRITGKRSDGFHSETRRTVHQTDVDPAVERPLPAHRAGSLSDQDPGTQEKLAALRSGLDQLASASGVLEIPVIALRTALAVTGSHSGSFWRETADGWECHLADGAASQGIQGIVIDGDELFSEDPEQRGLIAPLAAAPGSRAFAAIRVRRDADEPAFLPVEREWLATVASAAAAEFVTDARLRRADRGADVALLAEMSREIASTLDLDRVLRLAVNLAARAVEFDMGAIALYDHGHCDVRAVAGADKVDPQDPAIRDLAARGEWAAGTGEGFYLSERNAPGSDAERIFVQIFGQDLATANIESALYLPLRDEEGVLGVLILEAIRPEFADAREREIAGILAAQATVAIRNARLYQQIPLAQTLGAFTAGSRALLEIPRRKRALAAGIAIVLLAAVTLIRWPLRAVGDAPMLNAFHPIESRALVDGTVERVLVTEGEKVQRGTPVVQLRDADLRAQHEAALANSTADMQAAMLAASRGDVAQERVMRDRAASQGREADILNEQLGLGVVRAGADGEILTSHPDRLEGVRFNAGDPLLLVGRTDTLELDMGIEESDVALIHPGQEVRLRVDALPGHTFTGHVVMLAQLPSDSGAAVVFPMRAVVANPDGILRPGMTAHARVLTEPASIAGRLLRRPIRDVRLLWWRFWS